MNGSISANIDSCRAMIAKGARLAYSRIGPAHSRWLDQEDLEQEGLLAAFQAEGTYRPGAGNKYSTHLYQALAWAFSRIGSALRKPMRDGVVLELDRPVSWLSQDEQEVTGADLLAVEPELLPEELNCADSFVALTRAVPDAAKVVLIRGFLFGQPGKPDSEVCARIGQEAARLSIGVADLRLVSTTCGLCRGAEERGMVREGGAVLRQECAHQKIRKNILTRVATDVMMEEATEASQALRCLECVECYGKFALFDVREGRFCVDSMTCHLCLKQSAKQDGRCVGQEYNPEAVECSTHCRDRRACRHLSKETKMTADELNDDDFKDIDGKAEPKKPEASKESKPKAAAKPKAEAKPAKKAADKPVKEKAEKPAAKAEKKEKPAAKPAKKEAAKKAEKPAAKPKKEKEPEEAPPKGCTKWPFRSGSIMLSVFQTFCDGVTPEQLKKVKREVEKRAEQADPPRDPKNSWALMLRVMQSGRNGKTAESCTHTWKIDASGGGFRIYNVKQVEGVKEEKPKAKAKAAK